jgi:hypothetical protein
MVAWIPMLDDDKESDAEESNARFRFGALPGFWDGAKLLGKEVGRSVGVPKWTAWDIYLFYPPGAEWTDAGMPAPEAAIAQVEEAVVGTKGSLPPSGDQSRLPKGLEGRADVVGEKRDLALLLRRVAEPFAERFGRD